MEILNGLETIIKWHNEFDIKKFFDKNNPKAKEEQNSAFAVITNDQLINFLCDGNGSGDHLHANYMTSLAIRNIPFSLECLNNKYVIDDSEETYQEKWQELAILRESVIEIRMINEIDEYLCLIFIPNKITINQYYILEYFLKNASQQLSDVLKTKDIFYYSDAYSKTNDYHKVLEYAIIRIDSSLDNPKDLNIFGTTLSKEINR